MRTAITGIATITFTLATLPAYAVTPAIDNERVTVWDITLNKGDSAPPTPAGMDTVVMYLEGGAIKSTGADGKSKTVTHKYGDAVFVPKGASVTDTLISGGPAHEIMVALKPHANTAVPNTTKFPLAFPRPGSVKTLENDRVVAWHYTWEKGKPTPMHFHDKQVVVAYRFDGALSSTTPDGVRTDNAYKKGDIRFNEANRTHSELLLGDRQSAVMVELK